MNNYLDIILAPVITEKTANMEAEGKYAFKVANKANNVANLAAFLASEAAAYITGQVIHCDGGMVI